MSREKQIDDYINGLYERNQVYMEKELEYAEKCHKLEEQLGCPLEVVFNKALKNGIYGKMTGVRDLVARYNVITDGEELFAYPLDFYDEHWKLSDYKKTWWLKEDRSE